jgi:hypothetical protein
MQEVLRCWVLGVLEVPVLEVLRWVLGGAGGAGSLSVISGSGPARR